MEPRHHHYLFAHRVLPAMFFGKPEEFVRRVNTGGREFVESVWERCAERYLEDRATHVSGDGLAVVEVAQPPHVGCVIVMPPPRAAAEAFMVCALGEVGRTLLKRSKLRSPQFFTLELGERLDGVRYTVLCAWTQDGTHLNLGEGPAADVEQFVEQCVQRVRGRAR